MKGGKTGNPKIDHYSVLEVSPRASEPVIRAAHESLIVVHGSDKSRLARIKRSYEILSDSARRAEYDKDDDGAGKVIGDYRIVEFIAEGGFGRTYKAEHILTGEMVCIKQCTRISPQDEAILIAEAKAMWDLRHYSIPALRNVIRLSDGSLALVMSFVPGLTLEKIVDKIGCIDTENTCWIVERILNALMYIHYQGVVHGDIKPQNIIIQPDTHTVVLVDFGLALVKPSGKSDNKGYTKYFASPEAERGETIIPESDFYSLGMTMIYALSGDVEYVAKKNVPDSVPDPLCDFIKKLIVRDVLSRPNWEKEDLCQSIQAVRTKVFGRARSNMKPIKGL